MSNPEGTFPVILSLSVYDRAVEAASAEGISFDLFVALAIETKLKLQGAKTTQEPQVDNQLYGALAPHPVTPIDAIERVKAIRKATGCGLAEALTAAREHNWAVKAAIAALIQTG